MVVNNGLIIQIGQVGNTDDTIFSIAYTNGGTYSVCAAFGSPDGTAAGSIYNRKSTGFSFYRSKPWGWMWIAVGY